LRRRTSIQSRFFFFFLSLTSFPSSPQQQPHHSPPPPRGAPAAAGARFLRRRGHQGEGTRAREKEERKEGKNFFSIRSLFFQRRSFQPQPRLLTSPLTFHLPPLTQVMGKNKVLVKVHPEGKYVVDIDKGVDRSKIAPGMRVALRNDSYALHLLLPTKVDPLVSLMKVEKVPDSTYDMVGGLDRQIKVRRELWRSFGKERERESGRRERTKTNKLTSTSRLFFFSFNPSRRRSRRSSSSPSSTRSSSTPWASPSRKACCSTAPQGPERLYWPGQSPTTRIAPSSESPAPSWSRSTSGRGPAWSGSCS